MSRSRFYIVFYEVDAPILMRYGRYMRKYLNPCSLEEFCKLDDQVSELLNHLQLVQTISIGGFVIWGKSGEDEDWDKKEVLQRRKLHVVCWVIGWFWLQKQRDCQTKFWHLLHEDGLVGSAEIQLYEERQWSCHRQGLEGCLYWLQWHTLWSEELQWRRLQQMQPERCLRNWPGQVWLSTCR